ncbi:Tll0287-like domain-containing protein [Phyllobacterium endophyticum]|uniref:Histidine kinase n=1 Tax=Phyllobacterium endophyticum TaxID=1149773 RepID=A0A2P7AKK8_9HYPH|nr:DUF3365 domain-containing protein [Phyllobacterium endophyticum]MBB3233393.1 hypothetical protein [Phyllobacterium endophyticum]PSH54743.1 histidine kinase [Phyllobacterium endophyticum]TXR47667.1 DUF3365 domain-containing protein [Phyllobacterium endophyticum]TYR43390.1 DUF3365 domain-containing protein [Phyllobacterium endophyticum]
MHRGLTCGVFLAGVVLCAFAGAVAADSENDVATGERLAAFLRAGRNVISSHQNIINDASMGDKNLTGQRVTDEALEIFAKGDPAPENTFDAQDKRLFDAQVAALREVVDEHQKLINTEGVGFKGFIPATFARLVNERFEEKVGNEAKMKVTAPKDLVRNRKALPDEWEQQVIETKFLAPDWPKGKPFVEEVSMKGRQSFRMLIPEYYSKSCLTCHGQPKGEVDISGYPKEGGAEGDLGGAISITLFK